MKKYGLLATHLISSFDGVVVITSALHAEGREFDPRSKYFFFFIKSNYLFFNAEFVVYFIYSFAIVA